MEKCVCYCVTRNLYPLIMPSLNSMLENGGVDRVFLLAEDDGIGIRLPERVTVRNVSGQTYFRADGPNYSNKWTYMAMMKAAAAKVFPELDRILTIDHDTIILGDISELWELPMDDCYAAGAREPYWSRVYGSCYVNAGVLMWNLRKMREDGTVERIIYSLNTKHYPLHEQECVNEILRGKLRTVDSCFNFCDFVDLPQREIKILHFAGRQHKESWMYRETWGSLDR
jgi:lipopolysaccharide biosynthesis glycosyltransferase